MKTRVLFGTYNHPPAPGKKKEGSDPFLTNSDLILPPSIRFVFILYVPERLAATPAVDADDKNTENEIPVLVLDAFSEVDVRATQFAVAAHEIGAEDGGLSVPFNGVVHVLGGLGESYACR